MAPAAHAQPVPDAPVAPPLEQPGGLGGRCVPPSTTVVAEPPPAQQRLALPRVWELTTGKDQVVAVIDSGVDHLVPQLAGRVADGFNVVASGNGRGDCVGHGTFVAGIIAAQRATGVGFAGVAPDATILPIKQTVTGTDGNAAGMAAGIVRAVDAGARVINISAASFFPSADLEQAVDYADKRDVVIVASAANEADNGNPKSFPAAYPQVIAVGAVDKDGERSRFSEAGDFIDLAAPGEGIVSLGPGGPGHLVAQGTSFAAPFVAGVAALVRARLPKLTAAQVKRRLELTADHPAGKVPNPGVGYGVVNPHEAVTAVLPEEAGLVATTPAPVVVAARGHAESTGQANLAAGLITMATGLLLGAIAVGRTVLRLGRARNWRPARQ